MEGPIFVLGIFFAICLYNIFPYFQIENNVIDGSIFNGKQVLYGTISFQGHFCKKLYEEVTIPGYRKEIFNGHESVNILHDETIRRKLYDRVKIPERIMLNNVMINVTEKTQLIYIGRKVEIDNRKYIVGCIDNGSDYYVYGKLDKSRNILFADYIGNKEELKAIIYGLYFPHGWGICTCMTGFFLLYAIISTFY